MGLAGERIAERELARLGFRIVARNVRTRMGEIDLICRGRDGYTFVEVKTRRVGSFVAAIEAIDHRKAQRLELLAESWLASRGQRGARWRILVAALTVSETGTSVELVPLESR